MMCRLFQPKRGFNVLSSLRFIAFLLLAVLMSHGVSAQLDTKHWIPPFYAKPGPGTGTSNIQKHFVTLSTPSETSIPVTITRGDGQFVAEIFISKDSPAEYTLGIGNANTNTFPLNVVPVDSLNLVNTTQGLLFTSFQPFFVNIRHTSGSQGTSLTSKGQVGLGQRFYSGHIYTIYNTGSDANQWNNQRRSHFISVMATEDNTEVTFDLIKAPIALIGFTESEPVTVTLNANESFVVGIDHSQYDDETINNSNGIRITSTKDIACNTGSWLAGNASGQCIGSDQLVPAENTGTEYIFIKGLGDSTTERPMLVATEDGTDIFLNGELTPAATLDEGEFYLVPTSAFSANDNLYVQTTEKVFAYQTLSGSATNIGPTVGLNFLPPLNCVGAREVNIPFVTSLSGGSGSGRINIITKAGGDVFLNESPTALTGEETVPGIDDWVTYAFDPGTDNVNLVSDSVMNVALITRNNNVGTAGYFSGFTLEPVLGVVSSVPGTTPCVPGNATLEVFGFQAYQWFFNGEEIPGATSNSIQPEFAGNYTVEGIDLDCGFRFPSETFVIPLCPSTIGAAKELTNLSETAPGSNIFDLTYRIRVQNFSTTPAVNIQVMENIEGGLPLGATAALLSPPVLVSGPLTDGLNPDFNGTTDRRLLPGTGGLPLLSSFAVDIEIQVDMNSAAQDGYFDQVIVTTTEIGPNDGMTGPFTGQDFSHEGAVADPNGNGDPNEEGENDPTLTCFYTNEIAYAEEAFCSDQALIEVELDGIFSGQFTSSPAGLEIDSLTGTIDPAQSAGGVYTVTYTTMGRCPKVTQTEVTIVELPDAGTAQASNFVCIDAEEFPLADALIDADSGGQWFDQNGDPVSDLFTPSVPGDVVFEYVLDFSPCPVQSTEVTITVQPIPNPGTPSSPAACITEESVQLISFLPGADPVGVWTDGTGVVVSGIFVPETVGSFPFTYTVENEGCGPFSVSFNLEVVPEPNAGVSLGDAAYCPNEAFNLDDLIVDFDPDGVWLDADGNQVSDPSDFSIAVPGQYVFTYIVESPPCVPDEAIVNIEILSVASSGTVDGPVTACLRDPSFNLFTLLDNATPGGVWTDESGAEVDPIFEANSVGQVRFTYTVIDEVCGPQSTEVIINVTETDCLDPELIIPEGFSPNGDGIGDQWVIRGIQNFPNNTVAVYSRWGNEVFSARPYQSDWNGQSESGLGTSEGLPEGTYFYVIDLGDGSPVRKGSLFLTR